MRKCGQSCFPLLILMLMIVDTRQQMKRGMQGTMFGSRLQKPNIVLILTDDQDVELGSLNYMPKTLKAIKYQGAEFRHAYVTTPMCCPSRSSLLTGMYVHNHNVYTNNDNCSSTTWQTTYETRSFATYLSNAGYRTGYFGKYLNKYNGSYIPPGWREWGGLIMNSKYYNYSINMNGKRIKHGFEYSKDYYPDLVANDSIAFLRQSKRNSAHKPVMLTMSFPSPHGPEDSAPQYSDLFFNVTSHHIPSYDYAPNPDKQWILQVTKKMQPIHKQFTDLLMTKRLQTLQSVDAAVQRVVEELANLGELHNTYIIYTSDHGYHLGQFGLIKGKSFPFEFDVRVPFLVRGPGIDPGAVIDEIVLNIDLAPTFLDIAGVDAPPHMDGRSIMPLFFSGHRKRLKWQDTFLIESSGRRETPFLTAKLRKSGLAFSTTQSSTAENETLIARSNGDFTESTEEPLTTTSKVYESEEELDEDDEGDNIRELNEDNFKTRELEAEIQEEELTNQDKPPLKREQMQLDNRVLPGFIPFNNKFERLVKECTQPNMQKPCVMNQKWFCEYDNGRWRKHKCKSIVPNAHQSIDKYRKCACFTPDGLVYKKVSVTNHPLRATKMRRKNRRHLVTKLMSGNLDVTNQLFRNKRETLQNVDITMTNIKGQIDSLVFANSTIFNGQMPSPRNLETNLIGDAISGCRISGRGSVNCSNQVYHDKKVWQKSRHEVNNEIQELKDKLEKLKEIRRHLKHYRPDGDIIDNDSIEIEHPPDFILSTTHKYSRRKLKKENDTRKIKHPKSEHTENGNTTLVDPSTLSVLTSEEEIPYPLENCHCERVNPDFTETLGDREKMKPSRKKFDDEKMKKKARRQKKKENLDKMCSSERMNCFHHDNDHWKTIPLWTNGPFCFCMNSNNNTYSCIRTINNTHNFLYCEFTTGLRTFYNLRIDPFELQNRFDQLRPDEKIFLHHQLKVLVACKGKSCTVNQSIVSPKFRGSSLHKPSINGHHRYKKKKIFPNDTKNGHSLNVNGTYHNKHMFRVVNRNNSSHLDKKQSAFGKSRRKRKLIREKI